MNTFYLSSEDWAWMRRRLRSTGGVLLLLLGLGVAIQLRSPAPNERSPAPNARSPATNERSPAPNARSPATNAPGANNAMQPGAIVVGDTSPTGKAGGRSVPPSGWRRTSRGWEHVTSWPASGHRSDRPTLGERVRELEASEPVWVRHTFSRLRATPPWMVALIQVVAIGVICQLGRRGQYSPPSTAPAPDPAEHRGSVHVHG